MLVFSSLREPKTSPGSTGVPVTLRKIECFTRAGAGIVHHGITKRPSFSLFDLKIGGSWLKGTVGGIRIEQSEVKF